MVMRESGRTPTGWGGRESGGVNRGPLRAKSHMAEPLSTPLPATWETANLRRLCPTTRPSVCLGTPAQHAGSNVAMKHKGQGLSRRVGRGILPRHNPSFLCPLCAEKPPNNAMSFAAATVSSPPFSCGNIRVAWTLLRLKGDTRPAQPYVCRH